MALHLTRVDLPDGAWADVRSPEDVTVRGRGLISRTGAAQAGGMSKMLLLIGLSELMEEASEKGDADEVEGYAQRILAEGPSEAELELAERYQVACVVAFVAGWSYPEPITMDSVMDLPGGVFDTLHETVGPRALELAGLVPHVSIDDAVNPASPTEPSAG
jgi:hypothetical protein